MDSSLLDDLEHQELKKAGFWLRLRATFLDLVVLLIFTGFFTLFLSFVFYLVPVEPLDYMGWLIWGILCFLYTPFMESGKAQGALGKQVFNLKVVDQEGRRLSFPHALIRFVAKFLSFALFFGGFTMIGLSDNKKGLHDMMVGTNVIDTRK